MNIQVELVQTQMRGANAGDEGINISISICCQLVGKFGTSLLDLSSSDRLSDSFQEFPCLGASKVLAWAVCLSCSMQPFAVAPATSASGGCICCPSRSTWFIQLLLKVMYTVPQWFQQSFIAIVFSACCISEIHVGP